MIFLFGAPREIRTPVLALKGLRPGPLDDGGNGRNSTRTPQDGQDIDGPIYPQFSHRNVGVGLNELRRFDTGRRIIGWAVDQP